MLILTERFNVADYVRLAESKIEEIVARNRLPIIAGGTGLYINALFDGFLFPQILVPINITRKLQQQAKDVPDKLTKQLVKLILNQLSDFIPMIIGG